MDREDVIRSASFNFPERIPVVFHINQSCWDHYPRRWLAQQMRNHPFLFPDGPPGFADTDEPVPYAPWCRKETPWVDPWGCLWVTSMSGIIGAVTQHPLATWENFADYVPPDYRTTTHWYPVEWSRGKIPGGGSIGFFKNIRSGEIGHGHTLLKLFDILGYEHTLLDLYDETPEIAVLLDMLEEFNSGLVREFIDNAEVEWLGYAEDLGMQSGPLISPHMFRKYFVPAYRRLMEPATRKDIIIHMHTDGDIRTLATDLLELPVDVVNIQDVVNGIDWIAATFKGKKAIDLDIDRVVLSMESSTEKINDYISSVVDRLFDPAGGLILTYGLYPGVPKDTAVGLMDALESVARTERQSR